MLGRPDLPKYQTHRRDKVDIDCGFAIYHQRGSESMPENEKPEMDRQTYGRTARCRANLLRSRRASRKASRRASRKASRRTSRRTSRIWSWTLSTLSSGNFGG